MKKSFLIAAAAAAVMASCGSSKVASDISVLNGEWSIVEVEGTKINPEDSETAPFIGFNAKDKRLYGNTGCNLLTGSLKADVEKGTIDFSQTGSTRMMCANMKTERIVLDALNKTVKFKIDGVDKLTLNDKSGKTVIVLKKK